MLRHLDGQTASTWALRGHLTAWHFLPWDLARQPAVSGEPKASAFHLHLRKTPTFWQVTEQEILCCYTHDPCFTKQLNNPFYHNYSSGNYYTILGTMMKDFFYLFNLYSWLNCFWTEDPYYEKKCSTTVTQLSLISLRHCQGGKINNNDI